MQSMVFNPANGHIWLGSPSVVLQCLFIFVHNVVCNSLFAKSILSHSDIGKWQNVFGKLSP